MNGVVLEEDRERLAAALSDQRRPSTPHAFLTVVRDHVRRWNQAAALPDSTGWLVEAGVLQNSLPAYLFVDREQDAVRASEWVLKTWNEYVRETEAFAPAPPDERAVLDYDLAVVDFLAAAGGGRQAERMLTRLASRLALSQDEAGRIFGVSGETIRRWVGGRVRIPEGRAAELSAYDSALDRLEALFEADRLPLVIRRRADLFGGERALDWILRGRIADVATAYEHTFEYQA